MTRTERAKMYKEALIEKITNVICFFKGIANDEVRARRPPVYLLYFLY